MNDEPDIYRTARSLIREHGDKAAEQAARNIETMTIRRDIDGLRTWRWVLRAVDQLQGQQPPDGAVIH